MECYEIVFTAVAYVPARNSQDAIEFFEDNFDKQDIIIETIQATQRNDIPII